ncbi:MAG: VanZ family protein [Planctomycetota bacterium]|nr:VanZ family protein [Planctomycetota bacterium]
MNPSAPDALRPGGSSGDRPADSAAAGGPGCRPPSWRRWLPALFWMAAIFFGSSVRFPAVAVPKLLFPHADKLAHAIEYAILSTLYMFALEPLLPGRRLLAGFLAATMAVAYGATDELHQAFVPGRDCSLMDWLADLAGACTAAAVWLAIRRRS